jgi:hypothetical protein
VSEGVRTGELDNLNKLIKEVREFQICAEGHVQHHQTVQQAIDNAKEQREED